MLWSVVSKPLTSSDKEKDHPYHLQELWNRNELNCGLLLLMYSLSRHVGFRARQALIAAVHAKALRLNTSLLADVTTGKVVNLISNDVRRCDDAYPYLPFLILGPLHLIITMLLVAHELGFVPAIAGIGTTMLLVPGQVRP